MIYLYESVVIGEGDAVEHYEIEQGVHDLPLTKHPETGVAIRRCGRDRCPAPGLSSVVTRRRVASVVRQEG